MEFTINKKSFFVALSLISLLWGCAKELPQKISDEIQQNVFDKNIFSQDSYLVVGEENANALQEDGRGVTLLEQNPAQSVQFKGPGELAVFFKDYKIVGARPGEKIPLKFKLLKSSMVVLAKMSGERSNIEAIESENEKFIPLFQYPILAYGILEKSKNDLGEETRTVEFKQKNKDASTHVNISTLISARELSGVQSLTNEEQSHLFNKKQFNNKRWTGKGLKKMFKGPEEYLNLLQDEKKYITKIEGSYLYILEETQVDNLGPIEKALYANKDPRFITSNEDNKIVYAPIFSTQVNNVQFKAKQNEQEITAKTELVKVSPTSSTYFQLSSNALLAEIEWYKTLDLKNETVIDLRTIDFNAEYIYVPSTLGTPREVTVADPFYQGDEKIVKLKKSKEGIEVYEVEKDSRFSDNDLNSNPVMTIPGSYVDLTCRRDEDKECTPQLSTVDTTFDKKSLFIANFENTKLLEVNTLNVFTANDSCIFPVNNKLMNHFIAPGVINFELEKTYKYSSNENCISDLFFDDNLKAASFNVKFFYSLVRLNDLASKNYTAVEYPTTEDSDFGFFKDVNKVLGADFDPQRKKDITYLNRFNPEKKEIHYYLSETYFKEKNKTFLDATIKAMNGINQSLERANAGISINLHTNEAENVDKKSGDLRNNMIVLIDEPLSNGLLGYAPTVSNPRTGEILQGHVNMYSGTIYSITRSVYESMVDLSYQLVEKATDENFKHLGLAEFDALKNNSSNKLTASGKTLSSALYRFEQGDLEVRKINVRELIAKSSQARKLMEAKSHDKIDQKQLLKLEKEGNITSYEKFLERCSHNNAFHEEFFNVGTLGKTYFPGIKQIEGILDDNGKLKRYDLLSKEQKEKVAMIIAPAVYTSTLVHEFGHNLGLRHNFMGSADRENFYNEQEAHDLGLNSASAYSSIMDYSFSELNELSVFGKYDVAALRYAYAREVQTLDGNFHKLTTTLTDLKNQLKKEESQLPEDEAAKRKDLKLKDYRFCTDENAGLSTLCNRFDEGSNLVEITDHYTEKYKNFYKYRNFRDGREDYTQFGIFDYAAARFSEFKRIRNIFEDYEFFASIFGDNIMSQGCGPIEMAKYPICKDIEDRKVAVKKVADFFFEVLSAPDFLCATADIKNPTQFKGFKKLSEIYSEIKFKIDYIPQTCFDNNVKDFLAKDGLIVTSQGGKFLNDVKGNDPRFTYKTDIDVRGVWADKLLAMRSLVTRASLQGSSEDSRGSLADLPYVSEKLSNLLAHLTVGENLDSNVPFRDEKGLLVKVPYELAPTETIPEIPYSQFLRMFKLPKDGGSILTEELLKAVSLHSETNDPKYKEKGRLNKQFVSVIKKSVFDTFPSSALIIKDDVYLAGSDNTLAKKVILGNQALNFLSPLDPKIISAAVQRRLHPPLPDGLNQDEQDAFSIEIDLLKELLTLSLRNAELDPDQITGIFGEELGKIILKTYALGSETLTKIIGVKITAASAPADATAEIKKIYAIDLETLQKFLKGELQGQINWGMQVLPIMPQAI